MKKTQIAISLAIVALLFAGCGGGGSDSTTQTSGVPTETYTVTVVDDNIVEATVSAPECATFTANGNGSYTLKECIAKPSTIEAVGGFVDIDGDGTQDTDEAWQTAPLKLKVSQTSLTNDFTVTPLTTLASGETNLTTLATKLGVNEADLFKDVEGNRNLQRSVNAILIAAKEAGITKYDAFVKDFGARIKASASTGTTALTDARTYMANNVNTYKGTYGVVFGGFISDTTGIDLSAGSAALTSAKGATVPAGKVRLGGFVYDNIIANATIKIYDGTTELASTTSDENGRYSLEINEALLSQGKVLKLEAISGNTKLISYITTDEIKAGLIGKKLSSGTVEDLVISNVTTAKAVLVEEIEPEALTNSKKMTETKAIAEKSYRSELISVAAAIKYIVDNNKTITQSDTLALAQEIVAVNSTTKEVTTTVPSNITVTGSVVTEDPLLNSQLTATKIIDRDSIKAILDGKTFYIFDGVSFSSPNLVDYYDWDEETLNNDKHTGKSYHLKGSLKTLDETNEESGVTYSSDGKILYTPNTNSRQASRIELVKTETINLGGSSVKVYFTTDTVTAEPIDGWYDNFATVTIDRSGDLDNSVNDFSSSINKTFTINHESGGQDIFTINSNETISKGTTQYSYEKVMKNGKTFLFVPHSWDGDGRAFFLDFANHKVYEDDDYDVVGTSKLNILFDTDISYVLSNITPTQESELVTKINSYNSSSNGGSRHENTQKAFYNFVKSLAN